MNAISDFLKALKKHVEILHLKLNYRCEKCSHNSDDEDAVKDHIDNYHNKEGENNHLVIDCGICQHSGDIEHHSDHILREHPEYADFLFEDIEDDDLEYTSPEDMNIAVDRRPNWSCEVCGLRVSSKKSLKSHVKRLHPTMIIDNWGKIVNHEEKKAFGFKNPSDLKKNPVVEETSNEE